MIDPAVSRYIIVHLRDLADRLEDGTQELSSVEVGQETRDVSGPFDTQQRRRIIGETLKLVIRDPEAVMQAHAAAAARLIPTAARGLSGRPEEEEDDA